MHYEPARNAFIVTIDTEGETFSDERLDAIHTAADKAAGEAVIIELTDEDPPVLNN